MINQHYQSTVSIHIIHQQCQLTLSINSVNQHYQSTVSIHIIHQQCQLTLSINSVNQHYQEVKWMFFVTLIYISTTKSSWLYLDAPTLGRNKWRLLGPHLAQKHHGAQSTLEFQKTHQLPRLVILPW